MKLMGDINLCVLYTWFTVDLCKTYNGAMTEAHTGANTGWDQQALAFIEAQRLDNAGCYRYAAGCTAPTLYSSTYAAMARHLFGEIQGLPEAERKAWVAYLQSHQDDDGLFRDPVIFDQGWYKDDPLWCGRPHLTCHVITALACLGEVAEKSHPLARSLARSGRAGALAGDPRLG